MYCRFCGAEIPENGAYCISCGRTQSVQNKVLENGGKVFHLLCISCVCNVFIMLLPWIKFEGLTRSIHCSVFFMQELIDDIEWMSLFDNVSEIINYLHVSFQAAIACAVLHLVSAVMVLMNKSVGANIAIISASAGLIFSVYFLMKGLIISYGSDYFCIEIGAYMYLVMNFVQIYFGNRLSDLIKNN